MRGTLNHERRNVPFRRRRQDRESVPRVDVPVRIQETTPERRSRLRVESTIECISRSNRRSDRRDLDVELGRAEAVLVGKKVEALREEALRADLASLVETKLVARLVTPVIEGVAIRKSGAVRKRSYSLLPPHRDALARAEVEVERIDASAGCGERSVAIAVPQLGEALDRRSHRHVGHHRADLRDVASCFCARRVIRLRRETCNPVTRELRLVRLFRKPVRRHLIFRENRRE